jgi:hypothetical protein
MLSDKPGLRTKARLRGGTFCPSFIGSFSGETKMGPMHPTARATDAPFAFASWK